MPHGCLHFTAMRLVKGMDDLSHRTSLQNKQRVANMTRIHGTCARRQTEPTAAGTMRNSAAVRANEIQRGLHEIDSRPIVSLYRKLQHRRSKNFRQSTARKPRKSAFEGPSGRRGYCEGVIDRRQGSL